MKYAELPEKLQKLVISKEKVFGTLSWNHGPVFDGDVIFESHSEEDSIGGDFRACVGQVPLIDEEIKSAMIVFEGLTVTVKLANCFSGVERGFSDHYHFDCMEVVA